MAFFFVVTWLILLVFAIRLMSRGFQAATEDQVTSEFRNKKLKEERRYVTKTTHPEMEDVEVGDELLIVKFDDPPQDPLLQSLENRISELNDPWEEDDDDDDGDVPSLLKR